MENQRGFKVGDVVKCVDSGSYNTLTVGKDYVLLAVSDGVVMVRDDTGIDFYYRYYRFELSSTNTQQAHKFKVGDVVKCVDVGVGNEIFK